MPSYQIVRRGNGSYNHSLNIPQEHHEVTKWEKATEITVDRIEIEPGVFVLLAFKEDDSVKVRRFLNGKNSILQGQEE